MGWEHIQEGAKDNARAQEGRAGFGDGRECDARVALWAPLCLWPPNPSECRPPLANA